MKATDEVKDGVVSIFDKNELEVWKDIPNFFKYQVSSFGNIREKIGLNEYKPVKQFENKTSVGTYLQVVIYSDLECKSKFRGMHQLVCVTFNGEPPSDGLKYEVNHIDGDKHNNHYLNLAWITRKDNTLHALKTGLRHDNLTLDVYDSTTNQWTHYYSIQEFRRAWDITRHDAKILISRFQDKLFQDRWKFKLNFSRLAKINRPNDRSIKCYDYVNNKTIVTSSASEMQYFTGVESSSILKYCKDDKFKNKLLARFVFKEVIDKSKFPEYSAEEANAADAYYFGKKTDVLVKHKKPILVKDYLNGTIKEYLTTKEISNELNLDYETVRCRIGNNSLLFGKAFKYKEDVTDWPVFCQDKIEKSFKVRKMNNNTTE